VIERHKWAFGVVCLQHASNEREEVQHPTLGQGLGDRRVSVSFAENFVTDVRMSDALT
jgi:hypothetical protein